MHTALIVFLKEIRDNLRDHRTLLIALLVVPVFTPLLFVVAMKGAISQAMKGADELPVTVIGVEHAPNLVQFLVEQGAEIEPGDGDPEALVMEDKERVVLVIPADMNARYRAARPATLQLYYDRSKQTGERRAGQLEQILNAYASQLGMFRLQARGIAPEIMRPFFVDRVDLSTPMSRAVIIMSFLPYLLIIATIMGSFYLAIDTTAGERERGSLESLLGLPLSRAAIVLGKVAAAVVFSALSLTLTVVALAFAFPLLELEAMGFSTSLSAWQVAGILGVTLPFAVLAAGMLTLVASYAKSYKEAQTFLSIVMFVPMIPAFVGMLLKPDLTLAGALIPGFSQHLLIMEIIKGGEIPGIFLLSSAGTTLLAGGLMVAAAIMLYRSERILG